MDPDLWAELVAAIKEAEDAGAAVAAADLAKREAEDRWREAQGRVMNARRAVEDAAVDEARGSLEEVPA